MTPAVFWLWGGQRGGGFAGGSSREGRRSAAAAGGLSGRGSTTTTAAHAGASDLGEPEHFPGLDVVHDRDSVDTGLPRRGRDNGEDAVGGDGKGVERARYDTRIKVVSNCVTKILTRSMIITKLRREYHYLINEQRIIESNK